MCILQQVLVRSRLRLAALRVVLDLGSDGCQGPGRGGAPAGRNDVGYNGVLVHPAVAAGTAIQHTTTGVDCLYLFCSLQCRAGPLQAHGNTELSILDPLLSKTALYAEGSNKQVGTHGLVAQRIMRQSTEPTLQVRSLARSVEHCSC